MEDFIESPQAVEAGRQSDLGHRQGGVAMDETASRTRTLRVCATTTGDAPRC